MLKSAEREESRRLRQNEGKSIKTIARLVGVSSSSVSLWVRDIALNDEQKTILGSNMNYTSGSIANQKKARDRREEWQREGAEMYDRNGSEFALACALYWGEGAKNRNELSICNTSSVMLSFFIGFLRKFFIVKDDEFSVVICCYLNNGLTLDQIQDYWLKILNLPMSCLRKATVKSKYYDGKKSGKYPYGVCTIKIGRTDILQRIYGALARATKTSMEKWID